jgi:RNA polymerase sigma factor (sigma-70 family)
MSSAHTRSVEQLLRDLTPQVLGALTRRHRDFAAAEDATQEALLAASMQWPLEGVPDNPAGWLYKIALRRLSDHARSEAARRRREENIAGEFAIEEMLMQSTDADFEPDQDDTLMLLFMCCHPSLTTASAIALTLRAVGGLTTGEIGKAFFVPEATMAQRISRAKQAIKASNIPFTGQERDERLDAVMHVLYLIFNEGHTSSVGEKLQRVDLSTEAIRLTRSLNESAPDSPEVAALLALMLLTEARSAARSGPAGELIPLDEQDRTRWDKALIQEGVALIAKAMSSSLIGPYQLQAAIAAIHDQADTPEQTDWAQIQDLYGLLLRISDNPMVALNHAVATAMVEGVEAGLSLVDAIAQDTTLKEHYRTHAVRAHLYERAGKHHLALEHYQRAADGTSSLPERNYLLSKAARLSSGRSCLVPEQLRA